MTKLRLLTIAALALCLAACGKPSAQAADDPAFDQKVQAYLMAHPEVIEQVKLHSGEVESTVART